MRLKKKKAIRPGHSWHENKGAISKNLIKYGTIALMGIVVLIIVNWFVFSGPQAALIVKSLQENSVVTSEFGSIKEVQILRLPGSKKNWIGKGFSLSGAWSGTYYLKTMGEKKAGILKIDWQEESSQSVQLLRITETDGNGVDKVIWVK